MYTYVYTSIYMYIYISICINMSNTYIYVYINKYIFILKNMYADKCIQTHIHTYKQCMYVNIYIYIFAKKINQT